MRFLQKLHQSNRVQLGRYYLLSFVYWIKLALFSANTTFSETLERIDAKVIRTSYKVLNRLNITAHKHRYIYKTVLKMSKGFSTKAIVAVYILSVMIPIFGFGDSVHAATITQIQKNSGDSNATTVSATFDSTPTEDNLLIATIFSLATTITTPTGWSLAKKVANTTSNDELGIYYKVASGSESKTVTFTVSESDTNVLAIYEYSGLETSSVLDVTASTGRTTTVTSLSSGTTGSTSQADELAIAAWGIRDDEGGGTSYTNSFSEEYNLLRVSSPDNALLAASKTLTSTGAVSSTASWANSRTAMGVVATFKALPTATNTVTRTGSIDTTESSANDSTASVTVPSDAEIAIVATSGYASSYTTYYSTGATITLGGSSMTLIDWTGAGGAQQTSLWYIVNPASGNQTLDWDWEGTSTSGEGTTIYVAFYKGIDTTNPFRSFGGESTDDEATASTGALAGQNGDMLVAVGAGNGTSATWTAATELHDNLYNTNIGTLAESSLTGNVTPSVTVTSSWAAINGVVLAANTDDGQWYDNDWQYRLKITVKSSQVDENLSEYPVYVDLNDLGADFHDNVRSDGGDIRITKADGTTEQARELVDIDTGAANSGELYFKADVLWSETDTDFYIYFGNATATDHAITATYGAENTWHNRYAAVYHMEEDPSISTDGPCGGGTDEVCDSTANDNDLDSNGSMTAGDSVSATIGNGIDFDGSNDYLSAADSNSLDIDKDITYSMWIDPVNSSGNEYILNKDNYNVTNAGYGSSFWTTEYAVFIDGTTWAKYYGTVSTANQYTMFTKTDTDAEYYIDGTTNTSWTDAPSSISTNSLNLHIAANNAGSFAFEGIIDELRLMNEGVSDDYASSEYNNLNSPGTFYNIGELETSVGIYEVQSKSATATSGNPSATFDSTPTAGNLIVVAATHRSATSTPTISGTGWSSAILYESEISNSSARRAVAWFWKEAAASEPTAITVTWSPSVSSVGIHMREFQSGNTAPGVWELTDQASADNSTTAGTSQASGTVTRGSNPSVAVAAYAFRHGDISAISYTNNFEGAISTSSGSGSSNLTTASSYNATETSGNISTTASWTTSSLATGSAVLFSFVEGNFDPPFITQEGYTFENDDGTANTTSETGAAAWYDTDWTYRKKITIDNTKVASTQTDFPIYVDISDIGDEIFEHARSDGGDIRVTKSDGTTEVEREVVYFDNTTDDGELHFLADSLSGSADTDFYIYYGNSTATDYATSATYGAENVWSNGYNGVWHLNKDCSDSTADCIVDSTGNGNDMTSYNFSTGGDNEVSGKLGFADDFDGTDSYHNLDSTNSTLAVGDDYTISAWVNLDDLTNNNGVFTTNYDTDMHLRIDASDGHMHGMGYSANSADWPYYDTEASSDAMTTTGGWEHIAFTIDTETSYALYKDGSEASTYSQTPDTCAYLATVPKTCNPQDGDSNGIGGIGLYRDFNVPNSPSNVFDGQIDEVRLNNNELTANWISTEYENQSTPTDFYSFGSQEVDVEAGGSLITFASFAENWTNASSTQTVDKPAGTESGDLLLTVRNCDYAATEPTFTTLSGWTLIDDVWGSTGGTKIAAYYKVAGASEPASYTWSSSGCTNAQITTIRALGADTSDPIDVNAFSADETWDGNLVVPTVTPTIEDGVLFSAAASPSANHIDVPSGMYLISDQDDADNATNVSIAYEQLTSSAATGTNTFTMSSSVRSTGFQIVLNPVDVDPASVMAGSKFTTGKTLTEVRQGEVANLRIQLTNSGGAVGSDDVFGLFYDNNDGIWSRVGSSFTPSVGTGSGCGTGASSLFTCEKVLDGNDDLEGRNTSIATSPSGGIWMSFFARENGAANHGAAYVAQYVGDGTGNCDSLLSSSGSDDWNCELVYAGDNSSDSVRTRIAFAPDGTPWISTKDNNASNSRLIVAEYVGGGTGDCDTVGDTQGSDNWDCSVVYVGRDSNTASHNDIVIDDTGDPWVYVFDQATNDGRAVVATYVGGGSGDCNTVGQSGGSNDWDCTLLYDGDGTFDGQGGRLSLDENGERILVFSDPSTIELILAEYVGGGAGDCDTVGGAGGSDDWTCTVIIDDNVAGLTNHSHASVGPDGKIRVVFRDGASGDNGVMVAEELGTTGGNCDTVGGNGGSDYWNCTKVYDSSNSVTGLESSIAYAPDGNPWIQFADGSTGDGGQYVAQYVGGNNGDCDTVGGATGSDDWTCHRVYDGTNTNDGSMGDITFDRNGNLWTSFFVDNTNDGQVWVSTIARSGEILAAPSISTNAGQSLASSHADMTSVGDTTGQGDGDCIAASTTWNTGKYFNTDFGTGISLPAGDTTKQCTEIAWTLDTTHAVPGTTYRFIVATQDAVEKDSNVWRGPIAVATDAYPTITVRDTAQTVYKYSKDTIEVHGADCTDTDWTCEEIISGSGIGKWPGLTFDRDGTPWISFEKETGGLGDLIVGEFVGAGGSGCTSTAWDCVAVDTTGDVGSSSSLVFDQKGTLWVAYKTSTGSDVRVAKYVGSGAGTGCADSNWSCSSVVTSNTIGDYAEIVIDHNDNPWVFYRDISAGALEYAQYVGDGRGVGCADTDWTCDVVHDNANSQGHDLSVQFSPAGIPWVVFRDATAQDMYVANFVGSGGDCSNDAWECEAVATTNSVAFEGANLAFKGDGTPVIAYHYLNNNDLRYAEYVGSGGDCDTLYAGSDKWECETIATSGNTGLEQSIAIDAEGNPWVAYKESIGDDLLYARYVGSGGSGCTTTAWDGCSIIDNSLDASQTVMGFDSSGVPWIVATDISAGGLQLAKMKNPPSAPQREVKAPYSTRSKATGDLMHHLTSGLSPHSDPYGTCGGLVDLYGYCGLYTADGLNDKIVAAADERPMYAMSTRYDNNSQLPTAKVRFKTSVSPATQNVKLQVYRFGSTNAWEDVGTYSTAGCSTTYCDLIGSPSGTASDYYESDSGDYWVHFRVYQVEGSSTVTLTIDSFTAHQVQSLLRGGRVFREEITDPLRW